MSKQIKLDDQVYHQLDYIRVGRETFSHAVERLLSIYTTLETMQDRIIRQGLSRLTEEVKSKL